MISNIRKNSELHMMHTFPAATGHSWALMGYPTLSAKPVAHGDDALHYLGQQFLLSGHLNIPDSVWL
jgi:hypothetical protein